MLDTPLTLRRARSGPQSRGVLQIRRVDGDFLDRVTEHAIWIDEPGMRFGLAIDGASLIVSCSMTGGYLLDPADGVISVAPTGSMIIREHRLVSIIVPLLMAERGDLALHAAAVDEGEGAVLFCGASQSGKSTLGAARAIAGRAVLAEDAAVLGDVDGVPVVWPGPAGTLVSANTWAALGADPGGVGESLGDHRNRKVMMTRGPNPHAAVPARAVVVLSPRGGAVAEIERLPRTTALATLLHSAIYAGPSRNAVTFHKLGALVERVPVFRARLPEGLPGLVAHSEDLIDLILGTRRP